MTYIHTDQFRCAIIRGKAQAELDNLLPYYTSVISKICPTSKENFDKFFNQELAHLLGEATTKKTLDNHRTEIAGKLFGMYYIDAQRVVHISERTLKLLEDNDQPAFFKDLCLKMQFPSGMNANYTVFEQIKLGINIRQLCFLVAVLKLCDDLRIFLNVKQIGYYVLNSKSVLTKQTTPEQVVKQIQIDIASKILREIPNPNKKASSYLYQHIKEQLTLLQLANIVTLCGTSYHINLNEGDFIQFMIDLALKDPDFDFYSYSNLDKVENYKALQISWDFFISKISDVPPQLLNSNVSEILTSGLSHIPNIDQSITRNFVNTKDLGDAGEAFVFAYEQNLLKPYALEHKVQNKAHLRGIGFDIESFSYTDTLEKYIEVKATRRTTPMPKTFAEDVINVTKNEWIAAEQHQDKFYIYRVIFHNSGVQLFRIQNPFKHYSDGTIAAIPLTYRLSFSNHSGSFQDV
jgi:hypothetical protein